MTWTNTLFDIFIVIVVVVVVVDSALLGTIVAKIWIVAWFAQE